MFLLTFSSNKIASYQINHFRKVIGFSNLAEADLELFLLDVAGALDPPLS